MSIQVGRTYKVIGTLYIIKNSLLEAKEYLTKALNIFEQKCALNLAREVKSKLQIVTGNSRVHSKMNVRIKGIMTIRELKCQRT